MTVLLSGQFLKHVVGALASRDWSMDYLDLLLTREGSGVVSGAQEHFTDLKSLSREALGDTPVPLRFCTSDEWDE